MFLFVGSFFILYVCFLGYEGGAKILFFVACQLKLLLLALSGRKQFYGWKWRMSLFYALCERLLLV